MSKKHYHHARQMEERHFSFGNNELLDQYKLHVKLYITQNLPTQSNHIL